MTHLTCTIDDHVATITLDNAPQNRIGDQMVEELAAAMARIAGSEARAVLLCAAGPDFSFGGDILPWPERGRSELRATFERYMDVFNQFERLPLPVVAAVQGLCFGGGLELALRADMIFASTTARFGHPEQTLGIVTLLGGIYRVAERAGRARASEWALTSEQISAAAMEHAGVVNKVFADGDLLAESRAFVEKLAMGPTRPTPRTRKRQGHIVHSTEGAAADAGGSVDHPHRIDYRLHRHSRVQRLQRDEGSYP